MRADYHSAHYPYDPPGPLERFDASNGTAVVHDLLAGPLPVEYGDCDVIYTEPSWRRGFDIFNTRAGAGDGRTYADYCRAVVSVLDLGLPSVLVWGAHAKPYLPARRTEVPIRLNEHEAIAFLFNGASLNAKPSTIRDIVSDLAKRYRHVGDPNCGYGLSARAFTEERKRFTASDLNPRCIGYIASHHETWKEPASV